MGIQVQATADIRTPIEHDWEVHSAPKSVLSWDDLWDDLWIEAPDPEASVVPGLSHRVREVELWTGWSDRQLAEVVGTTHPTIAAIRRGRGNVRTARLLNRLTSIHETVERLHHVCNGDASEVRLLLGRELAPGHRSAQWLLSQGRYADAYLAALDARTPRRVGGMMQSRVPRRPSGEVVALEDADED